MGKILLVNENKGLFILLAIYGLQKGGIEAPVPQPAPAGGTKGNIHIVIWHVCSVANTACLYTAPKTGRRTQARGTLGYQPKSSFVCRKNRGYNGQQMLGVYCALKTIWVYQGGGIFLRQLSCYIFIRLSVQFLV
ncbi:MAG: hypothetical protein H6564_06020 [Lewinellaceae bacterium]|nr:hypothetical protein [Lewinellaceae bacterium]